MDVLSPDDGLLTLIQETSAVMKLCYAYNREQRPPQPELIQFTDELNSLGEVFNAVSLLVGKYRASSDSFKPTAIFELLASPDGPLINFWWELEQFKEKLERETGWRALKRNVVGPLKDYELRRVLEASKSLKVALLVALSEDQATITLATDPKTGSKSSNPLPIYPVTTSSYERPPCQISTDPSTRYHTATVGGIIQVEDIHFGLTVANIFHSLASSRSNQGLSYPLSSPIPLKLRGGTSLTSRRGLRPKHEAVQETETESRSLAYREPIGYLSTAKHEIRGEKKINWALLDLVEDIDGLNSFEILSDSGWLETIIVDTIKEHRLPPDSLNDSFEVWIPTGRYDGKSGGKLVLKGRMTAPWDMANMVNLIRVEFDTPGQITMDDIGSWVVDSATHELVGMVDSLPSDGVHANIYRASSILESVRELHPEARLVKRRSSNKSTTKVSEDISRKGKGKGKMNQIRLDESPDLEAPNKFVPEEPEVEMQLQLEHGGGSSLKKLLGRYRIIQPNIYADAENRGNPLPPIGDWKIWEVSGPAKMTWETQVQPQVRTIIQGSLSTSKAIATPILALYGLMLCKAELDDDQAAPTVTIACSLKDYRTRLRKSIRRSGVLEAYRFDIMTTNMPVSFV